MFLYTTPKRAFLSLIVCHHIWGCAGTPSSAPLTITQADAQVQMLREVFDPSSIEEDLLLIQPNFARPQLQLVQQEPQAPFTPQVTEESITDGPVEQTSIEQDPASISTIYRVQLLALSNRELAQQLRDELALSLSVPMYVQNRNHLYVIQGGDYAMRGEAQSLLELVKDLSSDYGDAYIVSIDNRLETNADAIDDRPVASSEDVANTGTPTQTGELVRTFGWRVLLDQFLSHEEADRLRNRAIARLNRRDVDITFKAPWYKVEVGHFSEEKDAQSAAEKIKRRYPNALKVRSQVLVPRPD